MSVLLLKKIKIETIIDKIVGGKVIQNKIVKKIVLWIMPLFLIVGYAFNITSLIYFPIIFLMYALVNRTNYRMTFYLTFMWWFFLLLITKDMDCLFTTLLLGMLGDIVGILITKIKDIELPKIKVSKLISKLSYLMPLIIFVAIEFLYYMININQYFSFSILPIGLSLIIIYSMWLMMFGITGRTHTSNIIMLSLFIIFFIANQFTIMYRGDGISFGDIALITDVGEGLDTVKTNLIPTLIGCRKIIIVLILNMVFIIKTFLLLKTEKIKFKKRWYGLIGLIILATLSIPIEKKDNAINNITFTDKNVKRTSSINDCFGAYRLAGGFYYNYLANIDYSEKLNSIEDLNKIYGKVKEDKNNKKEFKQPNIIVMFTEAFWDITKQDSYRFNTDPLAEYHEIKKDAIVIDTLSPTFGARSANTEFEFVTGGSLAFFPLGPVAYKKYYNIDESVNNPSITKELQNNGYTVEILNSSRASLYNCGNVYNKMGIDKVTHLQDELGYFVKDKYLVDKMIKRFDNKKKDEKLFYMTISMESHTPYQVKDHDHFDFDIITSQKERDKNVVKSYTQAIRNASLQLKRAYDYIQTLDEDTIIVFYGDHLPTLKALNNNIYDSISYFNTFDKTKNVYSKYNTETLILSNYDIDYDDIKIASPDIISSIILNNMDIKVSDYYKWLYSSRKTLPSVNSLVAKDLNGKIYDTSNLPIDMQATFELRKKIQNFIFK